MPVTGPASAEQEAAAGNRALRACGAAIAFLFRSIPKRLRFGAAIPVARCLQPLIARTAAYTERRRLRTDDLLETSLELLLMMLTRHGTTFDLTMRVDGVEHLPEPRTGGTLVIAQHTMLSVLFLRYLEDSGHTPFVITVDRSLRVPGTRMPARVLWPSPDLLLKVRRVLNEGGTVAAMIDRDAPERRGSRFETARGPVFLSDALLKVGLRTGARIVFLKTTVDDTHRVVSRLARPSMASEGAEDVLVEFVRFADHDDRAASAARRKRQPA